MRTASASFGGMMRTVFFILTRFRLFGLILFNHRTDKLEGLLSRRYRPLVTLRLDGPKNLSKEPSGIIISWVELKFGDQVPALEQGLLRRLVDAVFCDHLGETNAGLVCDGINPGQEPPAGIRFARGDQNAPRNRTDSLQKFSNRVRVLRLGQFSRDKRTM